MGFFTLLLTALVIAFSFYTMDLMYKLGQDIKYIKNAVDKIKNSETSRT